MKTIARILCLTGMLQLFALSAAHAQIRHVTVRAPRSPGPPMALIQTNAAPAVATLTPTVRFPQQRLPAKPSLDKAELQRRVVAFQKQRAFEGYPSAQYELGMRYLRGDGVDKDVTKARNWLTKAAQSGSREAGKKLEEMGAPSKLTPAE